MLRFDPRPPDPLRPPGDPRVPDQTGRPLRADAGDLALLGPGFGVLSRLCHRVPGIRHHPAGFRRSPRRGAQGRHDPGRGGHRDARPPGMGPFRPEHGSFDGPDGIGTGRAAGRAGRSCEPGPGRRRGTRPVRHRRGPCLSGGPHRGGGRSCGAESGPGQRGSSRRRGAIPNAGRQCVRSRMGKGIRPGPVDEPATSLRSRRLRTDAPASPRRPGRRGPRRAAGIRSRAGPDPNGPRRKLRADHARHDPRRRRLHLRRAALDARGGRIPDSGPARPRGFGSAGDRRRLPSRGTPGSIRSGGFRGQGHGPTVSSPCRGSDGSLPLPNVPGPQALSARTR